MPSFLPPFMGGAGAAGPSAGIFASAKDKPAREEVGPLSQVFDKRIVSTGVVQSLPQEHNAASAICALRFPAIWPLQTLHMFFSHMLIAMTSSLVVEVVLIVQSVLTAEKLVWWWGRWLTGFPLLGKNLNFQRLADLGIQ